MKQFVKKTVKILFWLLTILALLIFVLVMVSSTRPFLNWATQIAQDQLMQSAGYELSIGDIQGQILWSLRIDDLRISQAGQEVLHVPHLETGLSLWGLLRGRINLTRLELQSPVFNLNPALMTEDKAEIAPVDDEDSPWPRIMISDLNLVKGALNINLPDMRDLSLRDINISGDLTSRRNLLEARLAQASARWQHDNKLAFSAQGEVGLRNNRLIFTDFDCNLNGNHLNAQGEISLSGAGPADLKIKGVYSTGPPAALGLNMPTPLQPLTFDLNVAGDARAWKLALQARQLSGSIEMNGAFFPETRQYTLTGNMVDLAPARLGLELSEMWQSLSLNGALGLIGDGDDFTLQIQNIKLQDHTLGQLELWLAWQPGFYQLKGLELMQAEGKLSATAAVYHPPANQPSTLRVQLHNFSIPRQFDHNLPPTMRSMFWNGEINAEGSEEQGIFAIHMDRIALASHMPPAKLDLQGSWQHKALELHEGRFEFPRGSVVVAGRLSEELLDLKLDLDIGEIRPLYRILALQDYDFIPANGLLRGQVELKGSLAKPQVVFNVHGVNLKGPQVSCQTLDLAGNWHIPQSITANFRLQQANIYGLDSREITLYSDIAEGGRGQLLVHAQGNQGWLLNVAASPANPELSAWKLHDIEMTTNWQHHWKQAGPALFSMDSGNYHLQEIVLADGRQKLAAHLSLIGEKMDGALLVENLELAQLLAEDALPAKPKFNLRAVLSGTRQNPLLNINGSLRAAQANKMVNLDFSGDYQNHNASITASAASNDVRLFNMDLQTSGSDSEPVKNVKLRIYAQKADLAPFQVFLPEVTNLNGTMDIDVTMQGAWDDKLIPRGHAQITDGAFVIDTLNLSFQKFNTYLDCQEQGINIRSFSISSGQANIQLGGNAAWPWNQEGPLNLTAMARDFKIELPPWGHIIIDSDLALAGTYKNPYISGEVVDKSAQIQLFKTSYSDLDDVVLLNSEQPLPRIRFPRDVEDMWAPPEFLNRWKVNLKLRNDDNFKVNLAQGWFAVGGTVSVDKEPYAEPVFGGGFTVNSGLLVVFGTRIEQLGGTVRYVDPHSIFPDLNINASVRRGLINIMVRISGSALNPKLSLSSDPPLSQADILSLLAFGRPSQELNRQESSALSNQAMALAIVGQKGRDEMENIFGSTITPDVITVHNEIQQGSSLEAGKYLNQNLYLRYRQGTEDSGGQNLGLEWRLTPRITLQGQVGTMRDTGVDIFFHFVFGEKDLESKSEE